MPHKRTDIDNKDVHYMYEVQGMTQQEIADYYGVCQTTIYYRLHPEKQWRLENPEYIKEYYQDNRDEILEQNKQWHLDNPDYFKEHGKQWRLEHPEYKNTWRRDTEKGRASVLREHASRRGLGSISINKPFSGSEFHHFSKTHGIHMPAEIHQSIPHNLKTGKNMEAINKEAFEFLEWEIREKQWEEITGDWMVGEY